MHELSERHMGQTENDKFIYMIMFDFKSEYIYLLTITRDVWCIQESVVFSGKCMSCKSVHKQLRWTNAQYTSCILTADCLIYIILIYCLWQNYYYFFAFMTSFFNLFNTLSNKISKHVTISYSNLWLKM